MILTMKAALKLIQINPCGLVDNRQNHGELKEQKRSMMQYFRCFKETVRLALITDTI